MREGGFVAVGLHESIIELVFFRTSTSVDAIMYEIVEVLIGDWYACQMRP